MENHHYISNIVDIHDIQDINNAAQLYDSQQFYEIQKEHFLGEGEDTSTSLLALEYFTLSSKNAITESELKKIALDVILEDNILTKHYEPKVETKVEEAKSWPTRIKDAASDIFSILSELISGDSGEDGDSNDTAKPYKI
ncbi:MAG: hypothetical protein ACRY3E_05915 [Candidatus Lariskella arthropodorum]